MTISTRLAALFVAVLPFALVPDAQAAEQSGLASWYQLPGRTACGGRHNPEAMTAAHRTFACGTRVRVTNVSNGRSAVVTVVDRGPFVRGRIIDMSRGAARSIGLIQSGVGRVRVAAAQ
ncbi:septal ring lytic transglycosylase RlpA family protein [Phreatobacter aquaticus]|uniref:Endolytic peptidoglycan transglycosylase RlpA n=1 Tax=Phreatobacter aquaticus TaxID=2570229 RepID=A0A4D7QCS0_9HYPH|nr:septal ring lytic transglycosylase RlpA family protein [Phreatobacter aquaticus]QCK84295.1 septal ring lytic transglycosylase RlpA family protein [Phreatobacter aquaticus]